MGYLEGFGKYLPARVVPNAEMGAMVGCDAEWIANVSGIDERRFAAADETVVTLAAKAGRDCLEKTGVEPGTIGMLIVSSVTAERRVPGPASAVARELGLEGVPALDIPVASTGSLFGLAVADRFAHVYRRVLVIAAEKMSNLILTPPMERGVAILFGDGAGAALVSAETGPAEILDAALHSDGAFCDDLKLDYNAPISMNGRTVILQASRKIPAAIGEVLERTGRRAAEVDAFLMHQANQNLIVRVAQAVGVSEMRFYSNIRRYGNTSSASMLIAAAEWAAEHGFRADGLVCFAAFGAGFHWGAMLARGTA